MTAGDRFYFFRLKGPRSTFPQDMTPDEAALMRSHAAYWAAHLDTGHSIVFGPVADPQGVWGLGIVRANDDEQMGELRDNDPVIKSGLGFSYEVLPLIRAMVKA